MATERKAARHPPISTLQSSAWDPSAQRPPCFWPAPGLTVAVIERDAEVYKLPRAVALDGEIIRGFQRLGLGEEVASLLQPIRPGERVGFGNSKREWLFKQTPSPFSSSGWQSLNMFDQPELEGYLRETALAEAGVTAHIGAEATALTDEGDHVVIDGQPLESGEAFRLAARYLVGCDGASSFVRRSIGSSWHDLGYDHDWLVVDIVTHPGHPLDRNTMQVCDPDRLSTYVRTKDPYRRWEFKLNPGETWEEMLEPKRIESLIDPWAARGTYDIRRAAVYQFHAAVADQWRRGNIFIAGDAAHQTPPFLGQGMNAGMRDAINLAWKLPLVMSGEADPALLHSYQAERHAHATDLVDWAVAIGQLMEHLAAVEATERNGEAPPEVPAKQQSSGYGQGREMPPLRDGVIMLDQLSDSGSTGYLFSQPMVRDATGREFRLDDALGPGFAVVARNRNALKISPTSEAVLSRLNARRIALDGLDVTRGKIDRLFGEADAAIVRPDRYVFGHTDKSHGLDDLIAQLAHLLHLT